MMIGSKSIQSLHFGPVSKAESWDCVALLIIAREVTIMEQKIQSENIC